MGDWIGVLEDVVGMGVVTPGEGRVPAKGDADADADVVGGAAEVEVLGCCCPLLWFLLLLPPSVALLARKSLVSFKKVLESLVD